MDLDANDEDSMKTTFTISMILTKIFMNKRKNAFITIKKNDCRQGIQIKNCKKIATMCLLFVCHFTINWPYFFRISAILLCEVILCVWLVDSAPHMNATNIPIIFSAECSDNAHAVWLSIEIKNEW